MRPPAPDPSIVLALFDEGVDSIVRIAERIDRHPAWDHPACGAWTAADVVRHELDVIGWYHDWLDRAMAGDGSPAFRMEDLDARAEAGVRGLAAAEPNQACAEFAGEARRYRQRVEPRWDTPFGYPAGTTTAGLHAGIAAAEWHLHAWDLSRAIGEQHQPSDPAALLIAVTSCRRLAPGGLRQRIEHRAAPLAARRQPWPTLLTASGRTP